MKTEQEQIKKMARTMCGYCSTDDKCAVSKNGREPDICANVDTQHCLYKEYAERLIESGYGKVSEYKDEIERLKEENKRAAISYTEYVLEEDTRLSVLRDNVAKLEQKNKRLCEENIEQYKKLKKQERKTVKQVQIDVLNKVKERAVGLAAIETYHICNLIDELIAEVENGKCNC